MLGVELADRLTTTDDDGVALELTLLFFKTTCCENEVASTST